MDFGDLLGVLGLLRDALLSPLILLCLLNSDNFVEHLVEKTIWGNHEVEHGDLDTNLRTVVRRGHLGGDIELELIRECDLFVTELE